MVAEFIEVVVSTKISRSPDHMEVIVLLRNSTHKKQSNSKFVILSRILNPPIHAPSNRCAYVCVYVSMDTVRARKIHKQTGTYIEK